MKLKPGDKIVVDLGGIEPCRGVVYNPDDELFGKPVISFWAYHGWKHMEYCQPHEIMKINKEWQIREIPSSQQPFAACDKCNRITPHGLTNKRYQLGRKTYCEVCLKEMKVKVPK